MILLDVIQIYTEINECYDNTSDSNNINHLLIINIKKKIN